MLIAQITDLHVVAPGGRHQFVTDTATYLERCVDAVNALLPRPDLVVATGDITDRGKRSEYERASAILERLAPPLVIIPGNHDRGAEFERAFAHTFGDERHEDSLSHASDRYPLHLIALDSTQPRRSGGMTDASLCRWLDARLDAHPERPAFIVMHHPPLRTGMHYLDAYGFKGLAGFRALIGRRRNIVRIACGHIHRAIQRPWQGTTVTTSISTSPQYVPEVFMRRPIGLTREVPGFALHQWTGSRMLTRTVTLE